MYNTTTQAIFQEQPEQGKPKQGGWKTINGYLYEAKQLAQAILRNEQLQGYKYQLLVSINIHAVLSDHEHKVLWKRVARHLRQHITALWVREPSRTNRCNYHLVVSTDIEEQALAQAIKASIPIAHHAAIQHIDNSFSTAYYVAKAKISGNGSDDKYASKRHLFAPDIRLEKYGTIGKFWVKPKKEIWADVIRRERAIGDTRKLHGHVIRQAALYLHDVIDGWFPLRKIRRILEECYPNSAAEISALADEYRLERLAAF